MPQKGSTPRQAGSGSARKRSRSPRSSRLLEESRRAQKAQSLVNVSAGQASGSGNQTGSNLYGATNSLSGRASGAKSKLSGDPEVVNIYQDWAREDIPDPQPGVHREDSPDEPANLPRTNQSRLRRPRREQTQDQTSKTLNLKDKDKSVADTAITGQIPRDTLFLGQHKMFSEGPVTKQHGSSTERTTKSQKNMKLTDAEVSEIQVLRDQGLCLSEVAEKMGYAPCTIQMRWANTFNEPLGPKESQGGFDLTPNQVLEVEICLSKGESFTALCEKFGSTKDVIMKAFRKAKIAQLPPLTGDQVSAIDTYFKEKGAAGRWAEIASTLGLQSITLGEQFRSQTGRKPTGRSRKNGRPLRDDEICAVIRYFAEKGDNGSWPEIAKQLEMANRDLYRKWRDQIGDPPPGATRKSAPLTPDEIVMIQQYRFQNMTWKAIAEKTGRAVSTMKSQFATGQRSLEIRQPKGDS